MKQRNLIIQNLSGRKLIFIIGGYGAKKFMLLEEGQKYILKAEQAKGSKEDIVIKVLSVRE